MSEPATQLWTDEQILGAISESSVKVIGGIGIETGDLDLWFINSGIANNIARRIRDEYEAVLAAKAQEVTDANA